MSSLLNTLSDNDGATYKSKRKGRGIGSGKGKTAGRGLKGQKSRSGVAVKGFEGGQMPIFRRLPKRGFTNYTRKEFEVVNFERLELFISEKKIKATDITLQTLKDAGLITGDKDGVKLLAKGELKSKISITVDAASEAARNAVEKAGGTLNLTEKAPRKAEKKAATSKK